MEPVLAIGFATATNYVFGRVVDAGIFSREVASIVEIMSSGWGLIAATTITVTSSYDMIALIKENIKSHSK